MPTNQSVIGIDLGSRTTKIVKLHAGQVESFEIFETDHDPMRRLSPFLESAKPSALGVTGYGRHLLKTQFSGKAVSEIKACARGAGSIYPNGGTVIDVGGQDSKVIELTSDGGFADFEMNDRCAAGTGRFLEVMARTLGYDIDEFWQEALAADCPANISSMCTVFAESEVVSLITSGADRRSIALGVHHSTAERLYSLISKVELKPEILFVGGVAQNRCIVGLLEAKLKASIVVPENPQIVSAIGGALIASETLNTGGEHHKG